MIQVNCPLCGGSDATSLWSKDGADYVRCRDCTLVYENPRLSDEELRQYYSQEGYYIQADASVPTSGYENYFEQCTPQLQREYFDIVERHCRTRRGRFLDVGCGAGGVVGIALERGWDAAGQEISSWAAAQGRLRGVTIVEKDLPAAGFPADSFDAVSMFDVLEHLPSPNEYVQEIFRILKPGGVLVVETPNIDGFFARHLYKGTSDLVKPRSHICLYGPLSARRLFASVPFSKVTMSTFPYSRKFSWIYFKALLVSRLLPDRNLVQFTFDESLRIICVK
jgi:spore maturation protein CgeB